MISFAYPNLNQAEEAGTDIYRQLTGQQTRDVSGLVKDAYCLIGYGLSLGLPVPLLKMSAGPDGCEDCEDQLAKALKAAVPDGKMKAIDWKSLLTTIMPLLIQLLIHLQPTP